MKIRFSKYHGTGNDFILIDNRNLQWEPGANEVAFLCNRHFGIGADGLMLLSAEEGFDFAMTYFNSDGNESTMCGNGGRCMTAFALSLGLIQNHARFQAIDGVHEAYLNDVGQGQLCRLKMVDTAIEKIYSDGVCINTGSPHFVTFVDHAAEIDVAVKGKLLRNDHRFSPGGTNVNFVEITSEGLFVRTYERGVEGETLSCGTGVTAAALVYAFANHVDTNHVKVITSGGNLSVYFQRLNDKYSEIWLEGPAAKVFSGEIIL